MNVKTDVVQIVHFLLFSIDEMWQAVFLRHFHLSLNQRTDIVQETHDHASDHNRNRQEFCLLYN